MRNFVLRKVDHPASKNEINSLLPRGEEKNSPLRLAKTDQLQYAIPKLIIQRELDILGLRRATEIWIYLNYPYGFTATVGIIDGEQTLVYIFEVERGVGQLVDVTPCKGVRENGSLIY